MSKFVGLSEIWSAIHPDVDISQDSGPRIPINFHNFKQRWAPKFGTDLVWEPNFGTLFRR